MTTIMQTISRLDSCIALIANNMGTFRYESVYIGIPAFYHAVGPDHPNPYSPGTWNTDGV